MNSEQIDMVQNSFEKVRAISDVAAQMFYNRLFELDPTTRTLFPEDMTEQRRKLMQMLGVAVTGLKRLETIVPAVQDLGRRHASYGVKNEQYNTVGSALLWTLEQGLGDEFTPPVKQAWTEAYTLLANVMQEAAAKAA